MNKTVSEQYIDFSSLPQLSHIVWKSQGWHGVANYAPWCLGAFFMFVGLVVLAEKRDAQHAPTFFIIALLCFLTMIPLKKFGKTIITFGIDRKTNTFWIMNRGIVAYEMNADRIREFGFQKFVYSKVNPVWGANPSQPMFFRICKWTLTYKRADNNNFWEFRDVSFATEKDASAVAEKAKELLRLHGKPQPDQSGKIPRQR
jgi:hypothetical protein